MRIINKRGIDLIKSFEHCRLVSYIDVGGIPTVGWGHTGTGVLESPITQDRADQLLQEDLEKFYHLDHYLSEKVNENQYSALICLTFNIGLTAVKTSTLLKKINSGKDPSEEWLKWNHVHGKVIEGLTKRRKAELALYHTLGD